MTVQEAKKILEYYYNQEWFFEKDTPDGRYNDIVDIAFYNAEDKVWYKASKILAW